MGLKRTFGFFGPIALIAKQKCFTSKLRIEPYYPVSFCALVKHHVRFRGRYGGKADIAFCNAYVC
jgi:hypothetical protein